MDSERRRNNTERRGPRQGRRQQQQQQQRRRRSKKKKRRRKRSKDKHEKDRGAGEKRSPGEQRSALNRTARRDRLTHTHTHIVYTHTQHNLLVKSPV